MLSNTKFPVITSLLAILLLVSLPMGADAQNRSSRSQTLPGSRYYNGFSSYYQGDYTRALRTFRAGASGAYQDALGRFMDSICYFTMMGECYYQMGAYAEAVEQYEAAIMLYTNFKAWPQRTTFPTQILADSSAVTQARISWGTPTRQTTIGNFSAPMNIMLGDPNAAARAREQGGVVNPASFRPVDVSEIMRCGALAIHRRHVIKGPTCKHDPFTKNLLTQLSSVRAASGTISGSYQSVMLGLAQSSIGQYDRAAATLSGALQIQGFDHPLTPIALLELGYLARLKGDAASAQTLFLEASYSAAVFHQYDIVGDALHAATVVQMINDRGNVFTPLAPAADWAKRERAKFLYASLTGDAIWSTAESGASADALKLIAQNARSLRDGDIAESRVGTQWLYCSALANSMEGETKNATRDLQRFLAAARKSSLWLYQVALADDLVIQNRVTERAADLLYSELLRDPTTQDWIAQPMETIAYLITPHIDPMIRWHNVNIRLKAELKALEISDLIRRHRFYSTLPLGGRQLALRWVSSAPPEALTPEMRQQQTDFLTRFPQLKALANQSEQLIAELRKLPANPERGSDEIRDQKKLLDDLAEIEAARETLLQALSLRREPCDMAFPPKMTIQKIQERLGEKQLVIAVFYDGATYYLNLISKNSYSLESTLQAEVVDNDLAVLLKSLGLGGQGGTTTVDDLRSDAWREAARKLSATLFPRTRPDLLESFEEVIVVPDGPLWYFPFELIQVGTVDDSVNLYDKVAVRYAPTLSTTVNDDRRRRRFGKALAVTGRTNARDDQDLAENAFTDLKTRIVGTESIDKSNKTPSRLLSAFVDQVVVWDEIDATKQPGLSMAPMSFDAGRDGSSLESWLYLPWTTVDQLIIPGYKSGIGGSKLFTSNGNELFLASCATLATGTKSLLLSRWPVGGQSTLDFTQSFVTESRESSPMVALRRAIQLMSDSELDPQSEPRIRDSKMDEPLKAEHPLFWAGYMLFDLAAADPEDPQPEDDGQDTESADPDGNSQVENDDDDG